MNSLKGQKETFGDEVAFLKKFTDVIILSDSTNKGKVAVSPALQGRVITSTANGEEGISYGWINHELFSSGDTLEHINPYGGEDRFWLGPEGGQFSIFFKPGAEFTLEQWQTPKIIDLIPFNVTSHSEDKAVFSKTASLTNYSGTTFNFKVERTVEIIEPLKISTFLNIENLDLETVNGVAYQSINTLYNTGDNAWDKQSGALSIWILGMYNPSPRTTIIVPFKNSPNDPPQGFINDSYFGNISDERLKKGDGIIFFKADGKSRGKIGLPPQWAKDFLGSYDAESQTLTIVQYNKPEEVQDYVNSLWKIQDEPFGGDVVNAYNDGPPEPGVKPLGPFYELETSSPAALLKPGKSLTHIHRTFHFKGDEKALNKITKQLFGTTIKIISSVFNP